MILGPIVLFVATMIELALFLRSERRASALARENAWLRARIEAEPAEEDVGQVEGALARLECARAFRKRAIAQANEGNELVCKKLLDHADTLVS